MTVEQGRGQCIWRAKEQIGQTDRNKTDGSYSANAHKMDSDNGTPFPIIAVSSNCEYDVPGFLIRAPLKISKDPFPLPNTMVASLDLSTM